MADEPHRGIWESVRLWLTAVAIPVVLALAGFWQFYLKEVWWPATAINLTTEVTVKQAGHRAASSPQSNELEAIEVLINARNPSTSTVYLTANYWAACGVTITAPQEGGEKSEDWREGLTELIDKRVPFPVGKHYNNNKGTLVAAGTAFTDNYLRANEKVSASFVFYVPKGVYDLVTVEVLLPTTSRENPARIGEPALGVDYSLDSDCPGFSLGSIYRVTSQGTRGEALPTNPEGQPLEAGYYGWQSAESIVELSLWQSTPSPAATTEPPEPTAP
jgi:hypothetical protein